MLCPCSNGHLNVMKRLLTFSLWAIYNTESRGTLYFHNISSAQRFSEIKKRLHRCRKESYMSYFGISGVRNPYSFSNVYAKSRVRTSFARRTNTAPRATGMRYKNAIGNSAYDPYSYGNYGNYGNYGIYDSLNRLQGIKNSAVKLSDSASRFLSTGKTDLFASKETSGTGNAEKPVYDADAICGAVKDFVNCYNDAVSSVSGDYTRGVQNAADTLMRNTTSVKDSLKEIGISVEKNGRLTLDEKVLKDADMEKVKAMLGGSYARSTASAASRIYNSANTAAISQTASARRSMSVYSLFSGSFFNRMF